jgi:membrane protein
MLRATRAVLMDAGTAFSDHQPFQLAAALSYYTLLSMAPVLLILIGLGGFLLGQDAVQRELVLQVRALVGAEGAAVVETLIRNVEQPERGIISMALGVGLIIVGATTVFAQLQTALNQVWNVRAAPANAVLGLVRARLVSFGVVLGLGLILMVSLVLSAVLAALYDYIAEHLPGAPVIWQLVNDGTSVALVALLIAALFKFVPDAHIAWRDTWIGAVATALLLTVGKFAIGLYLGQASVGSAYGAAGSLVVLMAWVYYTSLILLFGAELTRAVAHYRGTPVRPSRYARPAAGYEPYEIHEHHEPAEDGAVAGAASDADAAADAAADAGADSRADTGADDPRP